jgi:hypothetical protein
MVALSLTTDLSRGTSGWSVATLTTAARNEARKFGCTTNCNVTVQYPYQSNSQAVMVTVTDPSASRFFSGFYNTSSQQLQGRAAARVSSGGGGGGSGSSNAGSGCILALQTSGAFGVRLDGSNPPTYITGCEVISNSNDPWAIFAQGNAHILTRASAVGGVVAWNGATIANQNPNMSPPIADPYAATFTAPTSPYRMDQFRRPYGSGNGFLQGECIEHVWEGSGGGNLNQIDWTRDLSTPTAPGGVLWVPSIGMRNYSTSIDSATGRRIHNFGGGGGRFCGDVIFQNAIINFGPGVYYFNRDVTINNAIINATSNSTVTIPASFSNMMPRVAGQQINGATFVRGGYNFAIINNSQLNIRAPTIGPTAGAAMVFDTTMNINNGNGNTTLELAANVQLQWSGLLYHPRSMIRTQSNGGLITIAGADGTSQSGCGQVIAWNLVLGHNSWFGNNCANMGVLPFGTQNTGWNTTPTNTGVPARLVN